MMRPDRQLPLRLRTLRLLLVVAALLSLAVPGARGDDDLASARAFLTEVHADITRIRVNTEYTSDEKRALLSTRILTWLDVTSMATRALGPHLNDFTKEEFGEFVHEYGRFLTDVYLREIARADPVATPSIDQEHVDEKSGAVTFRTTGKTRPSLATATLPWRDSTKETVFHSTYTLRRVHGEWRIESIRFQGVDLNQAFAVQITGALKTITPVELLEKIRAYNAKRAEANPLA
jgi:ABC-type transporter MlaC component